MTVVVWNKMLLEGRAVRTDDLLVSAHPYPAGSLESTNWGARDTSIVAKQYVASPDAGEEITLL